MTRTFADTFGNTFGGTFGSDDTIWSNVNNLTLASVYTTAVSDAGITEDPLDTGALATYILGLTVNSEVEDFDWTGTSIFNYRSSAGTGLKLSNSRPATLISDTWAIASDHNGPQVSDVCYWRESDGSTASATVAEVVELIPSDWRLVRFSSDPSATLKRYPICTDASIVTHAAVNGHTWALQQDQSFYVKQIISLGSSTWSHTLLSAGSGRPFLVPTTNTHLIIAGILATQYYSPRVSLATYTDVIESELDAQSETLTRMAIPPYATGETPPSLTKNPAGTVTNAIVYSVAGAPCTPSAPFLYL